MNKNNTIQINLILAIIRGLGSGMTMGIYVKYLRLRGLDVLDASLVNMVFYSCLIIFDIPTGAFADVFGRKKSIIMSGICYAICCTIYGLSHTVTGFCVGEAIGAVAFTFSNGAITSWIVDRLKYHKVEVDKTALFANANMVSQLCTIPASIAGSYVMTKNISMPWFIEAGILGSMSIFTLFFIHEEYFRKKKVSLKKSYKMMLVSIRSSFRFVRKNRVVRFIVLSSMAQIFAVQGPNMQWMPRFESVIGDTAYLGVVFAAFSVAMIIGSYVSTKMVKWGFDEARLIGGTQLSIGILLIVSAILPQKWAFIVFILHQIPRGMYGPVKTAFFNDHIPGRVRATLNSFESVFPNVGGMLGLLTTGAAGQYVGIPFAWMISGVTLIVAAIVLGRSMEKSR